MVSVPLRDPLEKIRVPEKLAYSAGDIASNVFYAPATTFFLFYLTTVVGVGAAIAGTVLLVGQLLNGVTDLICGGLIDKTATRWGKARPWVLWMSVPLAICFVLMFNIPAGLNDTGKVIWAFVFYALVMSVFATAYGVAYSALISVMSGNPNTRVVLTTFRFFAAILTTLAVSYATVPLVAVFGGGQGGWTTTMVIYGVVGVGTMLIVFFGTRERVIAVGEEQSKHQPMSQLIRQLFANRFFLLSAMLFLGFYLTSALTSGIGIYYATNVLGDASLFGIITLASLAPILLGIGFMPALLKRFGKRRAFLAALLLQAVGSIVIILAPTNFSIVLVGLLIRGIGAVPIAAGLYAIVADVVDYGEWKFGTRIDGLTYSAVTFGQKVGSGVGGAAVGWLLAIGGYRSLASEQPASTVAAIQFGFVWLPFVLIVLTGVVVYFLRIEQFEPQIRAFFKEREAQALESEPSEVS